MKSENEIRELYNHCIEGNGLVSPTVIVTLEWILGMGKPSDYDFELDLKDGMIKNNA